MTIWVLVHRSTRFTSYAEMPDGFERFELPLDERIPEELSDRIIWGPAS